MSSEKTIAVISDIHCGRGETKDRHGDIGDILLRRAVAHLNDLVHPDVTVLAGDILENGNAADATAVRSRLHQILDGLFGPYLIIPGNRDGDVEAFYADFERPPEIVEVAGMRLLTFIDEDRPHYRAVRRFRDLDRFQAAREGFAGPIVAIQHVPVFPDGAVDCPYNHEDADAIIATMTAAGVNLSLSGHHHAGHPPIRVGPTLLTAAPALHRSPFEIHVVRIDGGRVDVEPHALAVDPGLDLRDYHVHTEFGYCAQDVEFARGVDLARRFGLAEIGFAEHSGQLYFSADDYWQGVCHARGVDAATLYTDRMGAFFEAGARVRGPDVRIGLEVDFDFQGRAALQFRDRQRADHLLGAIHRLASLERDQPDFNEVTDEFLWMVDAALSQGLDILAHPFRIIRREGMELSHAILDHVVTSLHRTHTAAEINFHLGGPPVEFVTMCLDRGVKLSLGGDAHLLLDIGNFAPHLALLQQAGAPSDLQEVLLTLPAV